MDKYNFKDKKVLIVGLGLHGGGAGAAKFFAKHGAKVTVTDLKKGVVLRPSLEKISAECATPAGGQGSASGGKKFQNIKYVLGRHRAKDFLNADLIIRGPGVPNNSKYIILAEKAGITIDTDIGIFFKNCPAPIIGITGSKGKSTTAALIAGMLKQKYDRVVLAGNIRKSVLEVLPKIKENFIVVLELSSFQLEGLARHKISPHIAVITNILREHLNRYNNFRGYALAKANIFKFHNSGDYIIINKKDNYVRRLAKKAKSKIIYFSPARNKLNNSLRGRHNALNIAAAEETAKLYDIPQNLRHLAISRFKGLEGRIEFVASKNGVKYYNDTTATMPDAAIEAINSFLPRNKRKIILIAGGSDKKLYFNGFADAIIKNVRHTVFLPGSATEKIKILLKNRVSFSEAKSMRQAIYTANGLAQKGDIVLLSPGAASFAQFQHEFERGKAFVEEVKKSVIFEKI